MLKNKDKDDIYIYIYIYIIFLGQKITHTYMFVRYF